MVKLPGFVKTYMPSLGEENLKLPKRFIQSIQGKWAANVALRDRYNNLWEVKVEVAGGDCYFKEGWEKFVDDNMIKRGHLIVFEYFCEGILDFKVHDLSDCLAKGVGGLKIKNTAERSSVKIEPADNDDVVGHYDPTTEDGYAQVEQVMADDHGHCVCTTEDENQRFDFFEAEEVTDDDSEEDDDCLHATEMGNDQDDRAKDMDAAASKRSPKKDKRRSREDGPRDDNPRGEQVRDGSTSTSTSSGIKKSKRDFDWFGEELFSSGLVQQPMTPYFVTRKRKSRAGELFVPGEVIKAYDLKLPDTILLIDPKEREFHATRKTWSDGRQFYIGGWKSLCGFNFVGEEDACICEFIQKGWDLCIRVSIVPEKAGQQQ